MARMGAALNGLKSLAHVSAAAVLLSAGPAAAAGFLSSGPGARAAAMGGAFTALSDDNSAVYYNPAGLAGQRGALMIEHVPITESGAGLSFKDGRLDFAAAQYPTRVGTFGFGLVQFAIGDIEARQTLADSATKINASQLALFLPYGFNVGRLSLGLTGKMVNYSLGQYSGSGYGLDLGAKTPLYRNDTILGRDTVVSGGVAIRNAIQPTLRLYKDNAPLERIIAAGVAVSALTRETYVHTDDKVTHDRVTFSADVMQGNLDTGMTQAIGLEYAYLGAYSLRTGYNASGDITIGAGVGGSAATFRFDYGADLTALAPQHRFTVTWLFTRPRETVEGEVHLSAYRRALFDQQRLKERFTREGRDAAGQGNYEEAYASFQKAAALDPEDREVSGLVNSSLDGYHLAGVKTRLDASRRARSVRNDGLAAKLALEAIAFDPASREAAEYAVELRNDIISSGTVTDFDNARSSLTAGDTDSYNTAKADHDVTRMRQYVRRVKAMNPDAEFVWSPLEEGLSTAEQTWAIEYASAALAADKIGDVISMARAVRRLERCSPTDPNIAGLRERLKKLPRKGTWTFYDANYSRQLYYSAAAAYVLGNYELSAQHLSVLLRVDPNHSMANALINRMRENGNLTEAQEP